ncbi:histidine phosphatase family protein [Salinibius halmophilus]|uniref:histidine phosphatase family protein n=1 Tax=Salinibius halmophilus TaxID=1853216 RepID=UPI000E664B93|nr:histidine phosphatase family protein [Salinibius halmophilus]
MAKYIYWLVPEHVWVEQRGDRFVGEQYVDSRGLPLMYGHQLMAYCKTLIPEQRYMLVQLDADAISPMVEVRNGKLGIQPFAISRMPMQAVSSVEPVEHKMGIWLLPESYRKGQHQEITRVYLVRHGETEWEKQGVFEGRLDSPLTEMAEKNARRRCAQLRDKSFSVAVSSSAGRALSTRNLLVGNRDLPRVTHPGLIDIHLGELEGMSERNAQTLYPEALHDYLENPESFTAPNGESFEAVQYRAVNAVNQLARQYQGSNILIVSHAAVIASIACHFEKQPLCQFWQHGDLANLSGLVATYRGRDGWIEALWREEIDKGDSLSA